MAHSWKTAQKRKPTAEKLEGYAEACEHAFCTEDCDHVCAGVSPEGSIQNILSGPAEGLPSELPNAGSGPRGCRLAGSSCAETEPTIVQHSNVVISRLEGLRARRGLDAQGVGISR